MSTKRKPASRIAAAVHENARGLYKAGFITKTQMEKYDEMCLEPEYPSQKIRALRQRHKLDDREFARRLNISLSTVRQWESGKRHPRGGHLTLLRILENKGLKAFPVPAK